MIISDIITITINSGNLPFYSKRLNQGLKIADVLEVSIDNLPSGSNLKIKAKCDICNNEIDISYKLYNKRVEKNGNFACSKKCAASRTKENLIKEYGVKNIAQVSYVSEKIKKTNIDKYGSEYFMGTNFSVDKIKEVMIEKYGVDNPQKSEMIREKTKKTNLERYGVDYILQSKKIREDISKTNIERYGFSNPSKSDIIKNKIITTNNLKYGGNSAMCNDDIKIKSRNTMMLNYGVDSPLKLLLKNEEFRKKYKMYRDNNYIMYLGNGISLFRCDKGEAHDFEISSDNYIQRIKYNNPLCTICYPINHHQSIKEKELSSFIKYIYPKEVIESYRDGIEIDIHIPELKIGFEFNGLYWHSESQKGKNYHLDKTNYFKSKDIRIIHIWEDEWIHKKDIVKSQVRNLLGLTTYKIYARKCDIREITDSKISNKFLNENHIQGSVGSKIKLGLYYNNELVSLMTFDQFEGRKKILNNKWNLSRFCNKLNTNVIGGASKLLNYFIKIYNPCEVISYADKNWSLGDLYYQLGFNLISETKPDYKYIIKNRRAHKSKYRKSKLNTTMSESEFMKKHGIEKIYDCGKMKFQKSII
jgi:hypothetical protein